jgi:hypothetical protein
MNDPKSFRAYKINIAEQTFIAAASHHRSEDDDPVDHYCVSYLYTSDDSADESVLDLLRIRVQADDDAPPCFKLNLTQRGRESTNRLGKLIASHVLMDLCGGRVIFDNKMYEALIASDTFKVEVHVLVGDIPTYNTMN